MAPPLLCAPAAQTAPYRKAVLFCPCGHESPVDGDWLTTETAAAVTYVCPTCDTTLVRQPRR
jgi:hypothetical protein